MTIDLTDAVVYDCETFPNYFSLSAEMLNRDVAATWEISDFQDDRDGLIEWLAHCQRNNVPMIGFNNLPFDYSIIHAFMTNPRISVAEIYALSQELIRAGKFVKVIWQNKRLAPQIDLFKINHFDNDAKRTSLKALQVNMRLPNVVESPIPFGTVLNYDQARMVKGYGQHDTKSTKRFAWDCMTAINFRIGLMETIQGDVMNFNDTKIGEQLLIQRIGQDICFDRTWIDTDFTGGGYYKRTPRQTPRSTIPLKDVIFPYIRFNHPEFQRVHQWMLSQTLTSADLDDPEAKVQTKGVFKGVTANVGNVEFAFGTGGIHASVKPQHIKAGNGFRIRDIDVSGYYPSAAIVNKLAPAHLGEHYVREYSKLPPERKEWQKKKGKKCVEANSLKLAGNGVYGKSNSAFSPFYDPQYTMSVTINCQLLLCMLAEWLLSVPTLQIIQANTDGITYYIDERHEPAADAICRQWEAFTMLTLEDVDYSDMWIRDVNNYVARNLKGELKQKGAYWHPDPFNYAESISEQQPPAWHKDLGNCVSIKAAVAAMVYGVNPETYIRCNTDPYDFMLRVKVSSADTLRIDEMPIQKTSRYYVSTNGGKITKEMRPLGPLGQFKRNRTCSDYEWSQYYVPGVHDPRIHTKNKSVYERRISEIESGWKVTECNDVNSFDFRTVNYSYYVKEAEKLIIR